MDKKLETQITQVLHQNWMQISHQILERFTTVSKSDLDAATTVDDLVTRISAKSDYPTEYVENQLNELCLVGAGAPTSQGDGSQGQQFGNEFAGNNSGQRNRSGSRGGSRGRRSGGVWRSGARPFGTYGS